MRSLSDIFSQIFRNLGLFSILVQCLLEQCGRHGAVCMGPGEDNAIRQGSEEMEHGRDIFVLHNSDQQGETAISEFFLQRLL